MADGPDAVPTVDAATLAPLVRRALGCAARLDGAWHGRALRGGFGGQGLYRFDGRARVDAGTVPWSIVLKVGPPPGPQDDPGAWDAPGREALAYRSGFLDGLPGPLVAPRCLGLTEGPDGAACWLWLEALADERPGPWGLDRYALAARHLGRFNGAYLVADSVPDYAWLSRAWLRRYVAAEGAAARIAVADDAPPLLRRCLPPETVAWLRGLWAEREVFLAALDRLPQTVCHHDAFRRNLFARRGADGAEQTVAVDWAFVGIGAVGAELAPLVVGSLLFFEVADATPRDLAETALAGYVAGLREAGWGGDEGLARLGFLATAALLYTVCTAGLLVALVGDPSQYPAFERSLGRPMGEAVEGWAELRPFQVELAEAARQLASSAS